jgi:D-alanine-D-alanine ligase
MRAAPVIIPYLRNSKRAPRPMKHPVRRITVITGDHGLPDPTKRDSRFNEEDYVTHAAMREAFESLDGYGYDFDFCTEHRRLPDVLRDHRPDLVVNFCDTGFGNVPARELVIPAYLEMLNIPYTGAPPAAMAVCFDKAMVRLVAQAHGVPVPREAFIGAATPAATLPEFYPALIKPNAADGSVGITKDAVVRNHGEAVAYLEWLRATLPGHDALIQEYLPGPEYGLGLIGNPETALTALPALEVDYSRLPAGLDPILSFESKAFPDSPYWTQIKFKRAALPAAREAEMVEHARFLFHRLGLRDYARFDFRTAADGEPKLLEVNPNPAWANDGKLCYMAGFAGLEYRDLLRLILEAAIARLACSAS